MATVVLYDSKVSGKSSPRVIDYGTPNLLRDVDNLDKKVIYNNTVYIQFEYSLEKKILFNYTNKDGFVLLDLFRCLYSGYKKIYADKKRYGTSIHYLDDLYIEGIYYDKNKNLVTLNIRY